MKTSTHALETPMISTQRSAQRPAAPNFPPCRVAGFDLSLAEGRAAALWELRVQNDAGAEAGSCTLKFSPAGGDAPSPRQAPHPVLGEWFSALRYTGCLWMEAGEFSAGEGFSEEAVFQVLWEGLRRLMQRNGVTFLVGSAPASSPALDYALRQGARPLEPMGPTRYFLFAI